MVSSLKTKVSMCRKVPRTHFWPLYELTHMHTYSYKHAQTQQKTKQNTEKLINFGLKCFCCGRVVVVAVAVGLVCLFVCFLVRCWKLSLSALMYIRQVCNLFQHNDKDLNTFFSSWLSISNIEVDQDRIYWSQPKISFHVFPCELWWH